MPDYRIHNAAWSGHHLILADEDLVDNKIRRPLLSPSVASGYNDCPARTVVSRLQPWDDDPFAANTMGTAGHSVMEALMNLPPAERTRERARTLLMKEADGMWSINKLERRNDDAVLRVNNENRKRWITTIDEWIDGIWKIDDWFAESRKPFNPAEVEVDTTEFLLDEVKIGKGIGGPEGIPLKGYVDLTEWVVKENVRRRLIDDWKFGKPKLKVNLRFGDDYGDQQRIYVAGYTELTGDVPAGARLIFPRGPGIRNIDVSQDAMRTTLLGFRAGWDNMNASCDARKFEARPSNLCGWCPAANSCPVAMLRTDKAIAAAKTQPSALQLGIPRLRPGATLEEVRNAPGVTVPLRREPDFAAPIEAVDGDMFPLTMLEPGETEEAVRAADITPVVQEPSPQPPVPVVLVPAMDAAAEGVDDGIFDVVGAIGSAIEEVFEDIGDPFLEEMFPSDPHLADDASLAGTIPEELTSPDGIAEAVTPAESIFDAAVNTILTNPLAHAQADDAFGSELVETVHVGGEEQPITDRESTMTEQHPEQPLGAKAEAAPYEETINGSLNLNSYAAMAACDLTLIAFEHMQSQNVKVGPLSLNKFAHVLTGTVLRVQKRMTGFANFQRGANARLRKFLPTALSAVPAPFRVQSQDGTTMVAASLEDWQTWMGRIENLLAVSLDTSVALYEAASITIPSGEEAFFAAGSDGAPAPIAAPYAVAL